ncbi:hypothetical protein NMG60_11008028 [Bertholletia excelsa]
METAAIEKHPLPPGATGWPIIGETLDFYSHVRRGSLEKFVADRRQKYASEVFTTSLIGYPMAMLCGAEGNKLLFSNEDKLVQVWFPKSMQKLFSKSHDKFQGKDPLKVRRMLPAFLKASALHKFVGTMDAVMKQQIEIYLGWETAKGCHVAGRCILAVACRLLLGIVDDPGKVEKVHRSLKDIAGGVLSVGIDLPGTQFSRALKATKALGEELRTMFKQRRVDLLEKRASPTEDILSHMLLSKDENGEFLDEEDIATYLVALLLAGYEAPKAALSSIIKYLAEIPQVYEGVLKEQTNIAKSKVQGELLNWEDVRKMKYSWNVASEVFRMAPPSLGTFREAIVDFTFAGHTILKGTKIHWNPHSTHKDPKHFPDPEKFDPSRFDGNGPPPYSFVPFGGGPRMCPANEYTKFMVLAFMHNMVTKFSWELLDPYEKVVFDSGPVPAQGLPIRLYPHKS